MSDKKVTLASTGTATSEDAVVSDIVTTALSTNTFVSGTYNIVQKLMIFGAGMALQNYRRLGSWNPV